MSRYSPESYGPGFPVLRVPPETFHLPELPLLSDQLRLVIAAPKVESLPVTYPSPLPVIFVSSVLDSKIPSASPTVQPVLKSVVV